MLVGQVNTDTRILPRCETCDVPMKFWHRLPRVKEPGWVEVFQRSLAQMAANPPPDGTGVLDHSVKPTCTAVYNPENHMQLCTASSKLNLSLARGDGLRGYPSTAMMYLADIPLSKLWR
jgi:hypothetical protein